MQKDKEEISSAVGNGTEPAALEEENEEHQSQKEKKKRPCEEHADVIYNAPVFDFSVHFAIVF